MTKTNATSQAQRQYVCPMLGRSRWMGVITSVLVGGAWVPLQLFHAPRVMVVWFAAVGGLLVMLHLWLLKRRPEHRLIITEDSITLKGLIHTTSIAFSEISGVRARKTTLLGRNQEIEVSGADGTTILVHEGFPLTEQADILGVLAARLHTLGKDHLVYAPGRS